MTVYKFDRFSRNKFETAIHKKTLKDNGTKVISATEFVPDTPEGIILESMLEGFEHTNGHNKTKIRMKAAWIMQKKRRMKYLMLFYKQTKI